MGNVVTRLPLGDVFAATAAATPDHPAILAGERRWTYGDLDGLAQQVSERLLDAGGDSFSLVALRGYDRALLGVGVVVTAAVCAAMPLAGDLPHDRREALVARARPLLVLDTYQINADGPTTSGRGTVPSFDDPAMVFTTSGSTAAPKLVPNTHRNLWASAAAAARGQRLGPDDRCLALGSMAHALGLRAATDVLWCGGAVVVPEEMSVDAVATALELHEPTCVVAPPPALHLLLAAIGELSGQARTRLLEGLRFVRSGGAALRAPLAKQIRTVVRAPLLQGYGMTEAGKIACASLSGDTPPGSVGRPLGVELRIVDGEIVVRGDTVGPGYLDDAHDSASAFDDGWFRTGDLGRLDDDGYLFVLGRRDDVVSRGGQLVSLATVEQELEAHPAVSAVLAAPVEHPSLGTDVVVGFVPRDGAEPVAVESLRHFLRGRLSPSQVPARLVALDALPLTDTGKPSRPALTAMFDADRVAGREGSKGLAYRLVGPELELATLWRELLLLDRQLVPADDFFALGADSLHLVELCTMISRTFGVEVNPGELIGRASLRSMATLLTATTRRRERPILVSLRAGDDHRLALYLVPGAGGTLAAHHRFVFQLEPGRRVLGFEAPGLYVDERPFRRIDELAAVYVEELLADAGDRPFALIGTSFGAIIVQEMARQLDERDNPAALLVMFDCVAPTVPQPKRRRSAKAVAVAVAGRFRHTKSGLPRIRSMQHVNRRAGEHHQPGPTTAPTVMFTTEGRRRGSSDEYLGWRPFLHGPKESLLFGCDHIELIRENSFETVPALDRFLAAHDPA